MLRNLIPAIFKPKPTLNIDFRSGCLPWWLTFTRASSKTYFDSTGTLQTAATNASCFDHDPTTLQPLGLSIHEARTNSIRNNTMQGAAAGTPGTNPTNWALTIATTTGLTTSVIGTGVENGITYIDYRVVGTASGAGLLNAQYDGNNAIAALQNQVWTLSTYWRVAAGDMTGLTAKTIIYEYSSVPAFLAQTIVTQTNPTSAGLGTQRAIQTTTLGNASTAYVKGGLSWAIANGAAIDITLRIGMPQLELGAFATPVIATSGAAATRAADVCSTTDLSWYSATEGTFVVSFANAAVNVGGVARRAVCMSDGTENNRMVAAYAGSNGVAYAFATDGGSAQVSLTAPIGGYPATSKIAFAYKQNDYAVAIDGVLVGTDTAATVPAVTTLSIGNSGTLGSGHAINGYIKDIKYFTRKPNNAVLPGLTL